MRNVVSPFYQPIVDLTTNRVSHYEALARTPLGGVTHVQLIELGEKMGFVHLIDLAMIEHVCRMLERNQQIQVAVNVSVETIEQSCPDLLSQVFKFMGVASRLVFEITESVAVTNQDRLSQFIRAVHILRARIAIDDFGTGHFRSHDVIKVFSPEFLKLSGHIVESAFLENDMDRLAFINRDVMAQGGHVIAERIDTAEKLAFIKRVGIRYGQGYFLGVPQPFSDSVAPTALIA
jgi:EAL domain-containing protein (putative c-di-GMP-specific phosphodiesterase class I)